MRGGVVLHFLENLRARSVPGHRGEVNDDGDEPVVIRAASALASPSTRDCSPLGHLALRRLCRI